MMSRLRISIPHLSHRGLYIFACAVWIFAGVKVLGIGLETLSEATPLPTAIWGVGSLIFFSLIIFPRVVRKNVNAIAEDSADRLPIYRAFRPSSWGIMAFMITLGITLRASGIAGDSFIAGFYMGLGTSLLGATRHYIRPIWLGYAYRSHRAS